jgi:hypothetical protein
MRHTPSTREYPLGERSGKILFGRKCNPVRMKQEGTISFGRSKKKVPAPYSGLNYNKARIKRDARKWAGRSRLQVREMTAKILDSLVQKGLADLGDNVVNRDMARQMLRTHFLPEARRRAEEACR